MHSRRVGNLSLPINDNAPLAWKAGGVLAIAMATYIVAWQSTVPADYFSAATSDYLHTVFETMCLANAIAVLWVGRHSQKEENRQGNVVFDVCFLGIVCFQTLHMASYPGVPNPLQLGSPTASTFYAGMARLLFPLALIFLTVGHRAFETTGRRNASVVLILAAFLILGWCGHFLSSTTLLATASILSGATFVFDLLASVLVFRHTRQRTGSTYLVLACLLATVADAYPLSVAEGMNTPDLLALVGHICRVLALAATLRARYSEAIAAPYVALAHSKSAAVQAAERHEAVLHSISDGVLVVDRNLAITAANPVATHLIGSDHRRIVGRHLEPAIARILPEEAGGIATKVGECLRHGHAILGISPPILAVIAGSMRAIEYSITPVVAGGEAIRGAVLVLRDVTERWQLHEELRNRANYARNLIEANPDPILVMDLDGKITDLNRATEKLSGLPRQRLIGTKFPTRFSDADAACLAFQRAFFEGVVFNQALGLTGPNEGTIELSCNFTRYEDISGRTCGAFLVGRDVTEMRQVLMQLQFQAERDPLTALPNRRQLQQRLEHAIARAARSKRQLACLLIDLDDFKDVNDSLGHAAGDELLKGVSRRLQGCLRETDTVARIGGDEFVVLIEDLPRPEELHPIVDKLIRVIAEPLPIGHHQEISVTCSVGSAIYPLDDTDCDALLRDADLAMYQAKQAGKNHWRCFTTNMNATMQRRVEIARHLRNALDRGEFTLHYQPKVDLHSGTVVGAEALLRWRNEILGDVPPVEFIPIAEDTGTILPIGNWVLGEACRQTVVWREETGQDISIAVNLSARQFRNADIVATVSRTLSDTGLPAHRLELELTETMLMHDTREATDVLGRLKALGVRIAIDDFGTGYSSLHYLKCLPLDCLKIDRSFVMDIPDNSDDAAIVRTIVALAHNLGLTVVAEGVETEEQAAFLARIACDEIQGYLISRPRPGSELMSCIQTGATITAVGVPAEPFRLCSAPG